VFSVTLKENWKATGKQFVRAFDSLGKALVKSAKEGARAVDEWANREEKPEKDENEN